MQPGTRRVFYISRIEIFGRPTIIFVKTSGIKLERGLDIYR
ncbi:hypothetical protein B4135_3570 [Caldibacillus debilis]|uniref:Uncharacterized protein n=1 Tax=Caldibacillus debilis TaxID=301148 RepID=A0A150LDS7_9BACI|nr:hypothetical protein B4135_3570 [Caldibacillus debilis]